MTDIIGWFAVAVDVVALYLIGHKTSITCRRAGMFSMASVNFLFGVQGTLMDNWSLVFLSVMAVVFQVRAGVNWREKD